MLDTKLIVQIVINIILSLLIVYLFIQVSTLQSKTTAPSESALTVLKSGTISAGTTANTLYTLPQSTKGFISAVWSNGHSLQYFEWTQGVTNLTILSIVRSAPTNNTTIYSENTDIKIKASIENLQVKYTIYQLRELTFP